MHNGQATQAIVIVRYCFTYSFMFYSVQFYSIGLVFVVHLVSIIQYSWTEKHTQQHSCIAFVFEQNIYLLLGHEYKFVCLEIWAVRGKRTEATAIERDRTGYNEYSHKQMRMASTKSRLIELWPSVLGSNGRNKNRRKRRMVQEQSRQQQKSKQSSTTEYEVIYCRIDFWAVLLFILVCCFSFLL